MAAIGRAELDQSQKPGGAQYFSQVFHVAVRDPSILGNLHCFARHIGKK